MMASRLKIVLFIASFFCINAFAASAPDENQFITTLAVKDKIPPQYTKTILDHAQFNQSIITKITTPYEAQPFNVYITHFLTRPRIAEGATFWKTHQRVLAMAEKQYGVNSFIITAILGIETVYGKKQGSIPVLNALYTLAFYYPPRERFFKEELAQYLIMCFDKNISPYQIRGSYAGAFGMPQFMPSSYRIYSVAFNKNSTPDITHNTNDAIMSIANYLSKKGWKPHQSYAEQLKIIMRYNTSIDYAMTASQLAQAIKEHVN